MLFNSLSIRSFGFGIEMNRLFKIGKSKVLITVILPNVFLQFICVVYNL